MIKIIKIDNCNICYASTYHNMRWTCDACEDRLIKISGIDETIDIPEWCPLEDYEGVHAS